MNRITGQVSSFTLSATFINYQKQQQQKVIPTKLNSFLKYLLYELVVKELKIQWSAAAADMLEELFI